MGALKITYDKYVHLVKGHVFYTRATKIVSGTGDTSIFDDEHPEIDSAYVYTYKTDVTSNGKTYKAGEIVMTESDPPTACMEEKDLPADLKVGENVELTKFYSTAEGLHTDMTMIAQDGEGRVFLFDLEAWFTQGYASQVGLILDASGGMAFASDTPTAINVLDALGIKKVDNKYVNIDGSKIEDERVLALIERINGIKKENEKEESNSDTHEYPQQEKLIGYYEIQQNSGSVNGDTYYRTWFLNTVTGGKPSEYNYANAKSDDFAKMVENEGDDGNFDFRKQKTLITCKSDANTGESLYPTGWGSVPMNFNDNSNGYGLNLRYTLEVGYLLNATPKSSSFTLSFTLQNTDLDKSVFDKSIEILYVGAESGNKNSSNYFRVTREGGDLKFYNGLTLLYTLRGVFGTADNLDTTKKTLTLAFNNDKVTVYLNGAWKPASKPAVGAVQPNSENYGDENSSVTLCNNNRTLVAQSVYKLGFVGGGFALELKLQVDELKGAIEDGTLSATLTLEATRQFTDTEFAETIKHPSDQSKKSLDDYGAKFTFTFEFNYTEEEITKLTAGKEDYEFVSIFSNSIKIDGMFGGESIEEQKGLPIGTYQFSVNSVQCSDNPNLHFGSISVESDEEQFKSAYECFSQQEVGSGVEEDTVEKYLADAESDNNKTATFYIGTSSDKENDNKRGNVESSFEDPDRYTNDRLGIIVLSAGATRLTIAEEGGQQNESFLYHVTGKTMEGADVDLYVSVKGGDSTTIEIPSGVYTVTEISDWSWRYEDGIPEGGEREDWIILDGHEAKVTLRYKGSDPVEEHKTVTFKHKRTDRGWLGGENFNNNHFVERDQQSE